MVILFALSVILLMCFWVVLGVLERKTIFIVNGIFKDLLFVILNHFSFPSLVLNDYSWAGLSLLVFL